MIKGWFGLPLVVWGAICLVVALIWVFVWPAERAVGADGVRFFLIRWGHAVVWLLLAAMCFLRATGNPTMIGIAGPVGLASLLVYLGFMLSSYVLK